jgi:hypothetical protein
MVAVHVREDLGLGRHQLSRVRRLDQDVLRLDDAPEAGDEMRGLERDLVEGKSAKPANISPPAGDREAPRTSDRRSRLLTLSA